MNNPKDILTLLGIPTEKIASFDFYEGKDGHQRIMLELTDERPSCPKCRSDNVKIHGYYDVTINNSVVRAHHTYIDIHMRRYRCKQCGKTFKESYSLYMPHKSLSRAAEVCIVEALKEPISYAYIGREYDVTSHTVINIFDKIHRIHREPLTEVICVDEFHFTNSKNKDCKYPFVISEPRNARILDIIESRRWEYLRDYFNKIPLNERSNVKYFVSDMHDTYRRVKKIFFKNSVHIIDHFHISKLFTNAIQKIRTSIMKNEEYKSKEYLFLKKHWKMFLTRRNELYKYRKINKRTGEVFDWQLLIDAALKKYPSLSEVYWAKEDFNVYSLKLHYWEESKKNLDYFIGRFRNSNLSEIREIANTFENWYEEIVNSYAKNTVGFCLTNAVAEANNNTIQTLVDVGYGYGNFERLRNRVLYINHNKKTNPD